MMLDSKTHAVMVAAAMCTLLAIVPDAAIRSRCREVSGRSGGDPTRRARRKQPIRPSSGARRRIFDGRWRFPDVDRRRRSSGATGCSCSLRCRPGSAAPPHTQPRGGIQPRDVASSSWSWRSTGSTGKVVWERTAREDTPHEASHQDNGHLGLELGDHRRQAGLRVFRLEGSTPTT